MLFKMCNAQKKNTTVGSIEFIGVCFDSFYFGEVVPAIEGKIIEYDLKGKIDH